MMTSTEMVDTYLAHLGYKRTNGDSCEPILPFFIGDVIYSIYHETIAKLKGDSRAMKEKSAWKKTYNHFNRGFFKAFTPQQAMDVVDKMDEFEEYVGEYVDRAREVVLKEIPEGDERDRRIIVDCLLCNVLAQSASIIWANVYKQHERYKVYTKDGVVYRYREIPWENKDLKALIGIAYRFSTYYVPSSAIIDCNNSKEISLVVDELCHRIVSFLVKDKEKV